MRTVSKKSVPTYTHWGVTIPVYSARGRFSAQFVLNGTHRYRVEKATEHLAQQAAKAKIEELLGTNPNLPAEEQRAEEILRPHGISLLEAARLIDRYETTMKAFGATLADAVSDYVKTHSGEEITVTDLVELLIRSKEKDTGVHHVADLKSRLRNRFVADFGERKVRSLTGPELARWLDSLPVSSRSRRNYHSALIGLFRFGKERGYLPDGLPAAPEKVRKPKAGRVVRQIFTPDELKSLISAGLKLHSPGLLPLVIQGFTGIRSEEIRQTDPKKDRLQWEDVLLDQEEPEIHVRPEVSKTGEERYVFIPQCLRSWFHILRKKSSGSIYSGDYLWKDYYAMAAAAGIKWKKNGPRKSFNTYHAALSGSLADTASEAGNSEQMVRQYYRKTVGQAARTAREWFSLGPEKFIREEKNDASAA